MQNLIDKYKNQNSLITSKEKNKVIKKVSKNTNDEELLEFYSTRYENVDVENFLNTERKERFEGLLNLVKSDEFFIDIGCANGGHMEKLYQKGIKGIGLDLSIPNIIKGITNKPYLKFIHGFAENIPFNSEYFDIAILGDVVEHFRNQTNTLSEILRVVKKGFVICFPNDTKQTEEHISPITVDSFIKICNIFKLEYTFFNKNGQKIDIQKENNFYWIFARTQKTKETNNIINKYLKKRKTHFEDKKRVLNIDQWKWGINHNRHQTEIDRFEITALTIKGKNILEVACGNGDLSIYLAKKGFNITGIDISKEGINQCKVYSKQEKTEKNTKFYVMDGTKLSFDNNSFDSVIFPEVFEHVSSTREFINEAVRVLKPNGKIFISVPDSLEIQWPGHIRFFTKETLSYELEQYTNNICFYEMNYKKWIICTFIPKNKIKTESKIKLPSIDIILPTYNRANKIKTAIQSIVDQTYPNWLLHIINDGGEDVSKIINEFNDKRIKYYNIKHTGKPGALNYGLKHSSNPYIAYMDDDDIVFPQHLELLLTAALENKKDFVYSDTYLTQVNEETGKQLSQIIENDLDVTYEMLRTQNYINHKQILHSRKLYEKVGEYDERLSILIDWDYIKRLAKESEPYHIKIITGNHFLYIKDNEFNSISGLWTKNPKKVGESLSVIFSKDPENMVKLFQSYHESINLKNTINNIQNTNQELEQKINNLQTENQNFSAKIDQLQKKENLEKIINIENNKIYQLEQDLNKIRSAKAFKLWRLYCKITNK